MLTAHRTRWLHATAPTDSEQAALRERGVPPDFVRHALDVDEQPRIEHAPSGATLVVLRVPNGDRGGATSLSVVVRHDDVVTIASHRLELIDDVAARCEEEVPPAVLLPELVHAVSAAFVARLARIDETVERLEQSLKTSMRNEEVLGLLECQKALVHLERALTSDQFMVERLREDATLALDAAARRRLDEALIEVRQALQMTTTSAAILASMMDAFASIISNNLNHVMKLMAALMIMLSIPTMVAGLWGMNLPMPGGQTPWAFGAIIVALLLCSLAVGVVFRQRRWL
jgi:magnesium transporter